MQRSLSFIFGFLLIATVTFGQTASTDSQTLRALLAEVRQLRHELQTATVAAQRVQIALYRLQRQETAVARATQGLGDARSKLADTESTREKTAVQIQQYEEIQGHTQDPQERKEAEYLLLQLKSRLEMLGNEQQQRQTQEAEAEEQLRAEQAKLEALQALLDRIDKSIMDVGGQSANSPH